MDESVESVEEFDNGGFEKPNFVEGDAFHRDYIKSWNKNLPGPCFKRDYDGASHRDIPGAIFSAAL